MFDRLGNIRTLPVAGTDKDLASQLDLHGIQLPTAHINLLAETNGLSAFGGYFLMFGVGTGEIESLVDWNEIDTWKFAWAGRANDYLCFGSTAWGDQYAYYAPDRKVDEADPVYLLDAFTMSPELLSDNFQTFFETEMLRNASAPYDSLTKSTRARIGDLAPGELLGFQPPLQLGGTETTSKSIKMPARSVMVANGDLTMGIDALPEAATVKQVLPYSDEAGRLRLRLITSN